MRVAITNVSSLVEPENNAEAQALAKAASRLAVMAPGAMYTYKYKMRQWDGKVYPIKRVSQDYSVPTGFLPTFLTSIGADQAGQFPLTLDDRRSVSLKQFHTSRVPLRPYQNEAALAALTNTFAGLWWPRGVIRLATGLGKTETAVAMLEMVNRPSIFLVHRKDLLDQAHKRMLKYGLRAGRVGDGEYDPQFHTVATVQTLGSLMESNPSKLGFLSDVEFAFVDEAHGVAADLNKGNMFSRVLSLLGNAYIRVGLTATPFMRDQYSNMLLEGATGRIVAEKDTRWGIENGFLSDAKVTMVTVPAMKDYLFKPVPDPDTGKKKTRYAMAFTEAVEHNDLRNKRILERLATLPKPALVLVRTTTHGNVLTTMAGQMGMVLPFIHGGNTLAQRKAAVAKLVSQPGYLMATGIFNEGIDIPQLRGLILAAGGKSEGLLMQQMGRGLRQFMGKDGLEVVDFYDLSKPLLPHSKERKALWESEGYEVEVV